MAAGGKMCHGISLFLHIADIVQYSNLNVAESILDGFGWNKYGQTMPAAPIWAAGLWLQVGRCATASVYFYILPTYSNLNVAQPNLHGFICNKYDWRMPAAPNWMGKIGLQVGGCAAALVYF